MTQDNRSPLSTARASLLVRATAGALGATLLLPSALFAAAGTATHPHAYVHARRHASLSVANVGSSAHRTGQRSSGAQPAAVVATVKATARSGPHGKHLPGRAKVATAADTHVNKHPASHATGHATEHETAHLTRAQRRNERRQMRMDSRQAGKSLAKFAAKSSAKSAAKSAKMAAAAHAAKPPAAPAQADAALAAPVPSATAEQQFAQDQQVAASTPMRQETLRGRIARFFFGPMRGSHESLVRQNQRAQQDGLARVQDEDDITRQVAAHTLVPLPSAAGLRIDATLPVDRRYTRPWTARFLVNLAAAHAAEFNSEIQVDSAVRTVKFQKQLIRVNGNAAPWTGDTASSHLMGGTIDLGKKGMSANEIQWMRAYLGALQQAGKIDVEEEFQQSCFHIAVYKSYVQQAAQKLYAESSKPRLHVAVSPSISEN